GAPVPQIAAARAERVRSLDPDIARVEREGIAAFDAVPLEGLQEELRHDCIAVVRIEYINVLGPKPGALVHSPGGAVGPILDLVQIFLGGALPEIVLRVIEHIDRRLPHVAGALGSREEIRGRCIDRPVAVPQSERVQDVARIDVILDGELRPVSGIVPAPSAGGQTEHVGQIRLGKWIDLLANPRFAPDSPVEEARFEPSVPRDSDDGYRLNSPARLLL